MTSFHKLALWVAASLVISTVTVAGQSTSGRITGKTLDKDGKPVGGIDVIATNQTSSEDRIATSRSDGSYSFHLHSGAYRLTVAAPYEARFDRGSADQYGAFSNVVCDSSRKRCTALENVIVDAGDRKIDISVASSGDAAATASTAAPTRPDRREVLDRWRIAFPEYERYGDKGARGRDIPFRNNSWYNPYDRNVLKGDYPIIGNDYFMILSAVSTTTGEFRRTPASSNVSSVQINSNSLFGRAESFSFNETLQLSFELFRGETVFKPRSWAIKISPTFSIPNYLNARENGIVNIDVRRGTTRTETHVSLEDAFAEVKLLDTDKDYDFLSVRAGIQPFNVDFRGFLYSDNNLGGRLFGSYANNKIQYNLAYFNQLEKDTNSGLNTFHFRHQQIYLANLFKQDFIKHGYTIQAVGAINDDRGRIHYDTNGFLVRPSLIGNAQQHNVRAYYVGVNGDGHLGRINLTNSYYFAFGHDDLNPIAGRRTEIRAHMAAVEASMDHDWVRFRTSAFFSSGDKNPTDNRASGFDAIFDEPNFVGGEFSYWAREGVRLLSTDVGIEQGNSLLPSLRSSKTEGQANFVNPGIIIFNAGADGEITPTLKAVFNANYIRFHRTEVLDYILFQPGVHHEVGYDLNLGVVYRPLLINNITFTFGGAVLLPGAGFKDIFRDPGRNCPIPNFCTGDVPNPSKPQFMFFSQMKLIF